MMPFKTKNFVSKNGYALNFEIINQDCVRGAMEVFLGNDTVKVPLMGVYEYTYQHQVNFAFFIEWEPYFDRMSTFAKATYSESSLSLGWVLTASDCITQSPNVFNTGRDILAGCKLDEAPRNGSQTSNNFPHPFVGLYQGQCQQELVAQ